jgi:hypothetical protein
MGLLNLSDAILVAWSQDVEATVVDGDGSGLGQITGGSSGSCSRSCRAIHRMPWSAMWLDYAKGRRFESHYVYYSSRNHVVVRCPAPWGWAIRGRVVIWWSSHVA